jgi:uncharacterized membrane protein YfcA
LCKLKPLKETFSFRTVLAPIAGFIVCAIAVLAGVGGGAILVPCYVAALQIPMADAVGLSQATICGQSILNIVLQMQRHHPHFSPPKATRPVINWEYVNFLLPFAMCGTLLGSMGNKISPDWLRIVLLFALFTYVLYRLIQRILRQKAEDESKKLLSAPNEESEGSHSEEYHGTNYQALNNVLSDVSDVEDKPQYPILWISAAVFTVALSFGVSYAKHAVTCLGTLYIVIVAGSVVYNCAITYGVREYLRRIRIRVLNEELPESMIPFKWNRLTTIVFPALSIFAGSAAAMLGIGGGLVFGFLLLEAGLVPEQGSATAGVATFFVAVQSATDFIFQDELRYDYGLMMFGAGLLSGGFGQFVLMKEIKKRGLTYLIVGALALIMGGSMLAVTIFGVINTISIEENNGSLGFGSLCG